MFKLDRVGIGFLMRLFGGASVLPTSEYPPWRARPRVHPDMEADTPPSGCIGIILKKLPPCSKA